MHKRLVGKIIDIDANFVHPDLVNSISYHVENATKRGVSMFVVPGSTLIDTQEAIKLMKSNPERYIATAGVHPYNALACEFNDENTALLKHILTEANSAEANSNSVVSVGECGLDFSDGFPSKELQLPWFKYQVDLACKLDLPLYFHVRAAHADFISVLDTVFPTRMAQAATSSVDSRDSTTAHVFSQLSIMNSESVRLRGVVHCFTGDFDELCCYLDRGLYVGVTGHIMSHTAPGGVNGFKCLDSDRDLEMRRFLERITLDRLMIETDAPYMGFSGCRVGETTDSPTPVNAKATKRNLTQKYPNVPSAIVLLIDYIHAITGWSKEDIITQTTRNAINLFGIKS